MTDQELMKLTAGARVQIQGEVAWHDVARSGTFIDIHLPPEERRRLADGPARCFAIVGDDINNWRSSSDIVAID